MDEKFWYLKNCSLFECLSDEHVRRLEGRAKARTFKRGARLCPFRPGGLRVAPGVWPGENLPQHPGRQTGRARPHRPRRAVRGAGHCDPRRRTAGGIRGDDGSVDRRADPGRRHQAHGRRTPQPVSRHHEVDGPEPATRRAAFKVPLVPFETGNGSSTCCSIWPRNTAAIPRRGGFPSAFISRTRSWPASSAALGRPSPWCWGNCRPKARFRSAAAKFS